MVFTHVAEKAAAGAPEEGALMMCLMLEIATFAKGLLMIFVGDLSFKGLSPFEPLSTATSVKAFRGPIQRPSRDRHRPDDHPDRQQAP